MLIPGLVRFWAISEGWVGLAVLFVAGPFRTHMYLVTLKICAQHQNEPSFQNYHSLDAILL